MDRTALFHSNPPLTFSSVPPMRFLHFFLKKRVPLLNTNLKTNELLILQARKCPDNLYKLLNGISKWMQVFPFHNTILPPFQKYLTEPTAQAQREPVYTYNILFYLKIFWLSYSYKTLLVNKKSNWVCLIM